MAEGAAYKAGQQDTINDDSGNTNGADAGRDDQKQQKETASSGESDYLNFEWIKNEGLLRDEGVICGMADVDVSYKLNAIDAYFDDQIQKQDKLKDVLRDRLETIRKEQALLLDRVKSNNAKMEDLERQNQRLPHIVMLRLSVGLLISLAAGIFQLLFIHTLLLPIVPAPLIVSLAIFFTGMFGQQTFLSLMFTDAHQEEDVAHALWKRMLLEFGLPLVAALLLCAFLSQGGVSPIVAVYFVFFLLSFLFLGKMFYSTTGLIQRELIKLKDYRTNKNYNAKYINELVDLQLKLQKELEEKYGEILKNIEQQNDIDLSNNYHLSKKLCKEIFLSEYHLAQAHKRQKSAGAQNVA